jgi:hypothetical protein
MKLFSLTLLMMIGTGISSAGYGSPQRCQLFIGKMGPQLDKCGMNKNCLDAPFKHALNKKNFADYYEHCEVSFSGEVATRMGGPEPTVEELAASEAENMAGLEAAPEGQAAEDDQNSIQASGDCNNAFYFLSYATKSCKTDSCVDQQYANTIKIPTFSHCSGPLVNVREARKSTLPDKSHSYSYSGETPDVTQAVAE